MSETWGDRLRVAMHKFVARFSYGITNYRHPMRRKAWTVATKIPRRISTATLPIECVELFQAVSACEKVEGDMAEAGVYRGGTAAVMLSASQKKRLHLFDTFEGLPHGEGQFEKGEWAGSQRDVKESLTDWIDRVELHPGLFPASATGMSDHRFSFVHLDLDLYDSTRAALEWFWPRLEEGGILFSHDYPYSDGVVKAFHEFFDNRPEPFLPLTGNQCLAVKGQAASGGLTQ
ncbi:MAG TPA: TylF/MycF/NovP-related O-methyltransferase [Chthonomonadales bacterium]|nr:TylF/MycF/NovP-related O-methyltransferase [Chthonomonadales bacterium]